jgi:hypothetical protein
MDLSPYHPSSDPNTSELPRKRLKTSPALPAPSHNTLIPWPHSVSTLEHASLKAIRENPLHPSYPRTIAALTAQRKAAFLRGQKIQNILARFFAQIAMT